MRKENVSGMPAMLAATASADDFATKLDGDGVVITKYRGKGGNVVIPATIGGKAVTRIGGGGGFFQMRKPCRRYAAGQRYPHRREGFCLLLKPCRRYDTGQCYHHRR
jgi:hypothetical protein